MARKKLIMVNKSNLIKNLYSLAAVFFITSSCNNQYRNDAKQNLQRHVSEKNDSINGKPIEFYIENRQCSEIAKDYFHGQFSASDNDSTVALLNLALTNDTLLRPFYFWCLNKVIREADGALMELTGVPARKYVEKFPNEYFNSMSTTQYIGSRQDWVSSISYSGYYDNETIENKKIVEEKFLSIMKNNCGNCSDKVVAELSKFAKECYGD